MNLQTVIRERGLKQRWIARHIGLSDNQFSRMMLGLTAIPPDKIGPIAKLLRLTKAQVSDIISNGEVK